VDSNLSAAQFGLEGDLGSSGTPVTSGAGTGGFGTGDQAGGMGGSDMGGD
jgi:hypothetical protein